MTTLKQLEEEINAIKERNRRVEADKAWELSWARKLVIAIMTYIFVYFFFLVARLPDPFFNSIVATTGFILSTLTIPFFKNFWLKYIHKK